MKAVNTACIAGMRLRSVLLPYLLQGQLGLVELAAAEYLELDGLTGVVLVLDLVELIHRADRLPLDLGDDITGAPPTMIFTRSRMPASSAAEPSATL